MLADEPTGNLDSKNSQEIIDLLKISNSMYQQTVIIITHDTNIALKADRILRIEDGRIAVSYTHLDVYKRQGKGGVGKSMVTSLLAIAANKAGHTTAILDADITGPSIPRTFGLKEKAVGTENAIYPVTTSTGIQVMSINLLLDLSLIHI